MKCKSSWLVALLSLSLLPTLTHSAGIEFEADSFLYNENTGVGIYRGDVSVIQGDKVLRGDEVEVFSENGQVLRIVSHASPANPSVFLDHSSSANFHAEAKQIEYDVKKKTILLLGEAKIVDGEKTLEGSRIAYDLEKKIINAGKAQGRGRVRLRIGD